MHACRKHRLHLLVLADALRVFSARKGLLILFRRRQDILVVGRAILRLFLAWLVPGQNTIRAMELTIVSCALVASHAIVRAPLNLYLAALARSVNTMILSRANYVRRVHGTHTMQTRRQHSVCRVLRGEFVVSKA